jgi:hypothetical protein
VVEERGAGEVERAARVEPLRVDRRHRPARRAEEHEHAAAAQGIHAGVERRLADPVVGHRHADAAGEVAHPLGQVGGVAQHLGGARGPGQLLLLGGGHGGDHARAAPGGQLGEQQPDATRRGVHEHVVARCTG